MMHIQWVHKPIIYTAFIVSFIYCFGPHYIFEDVPRPGGFFYLTVYRYETAIFPLLAIVLFLTTAIWKQIKTHNDSDIGSIVYLGVCCIVALRNTIVKAYEWYVSSSPDRFIEASYMKDGILCTPWGMYSEETSQRINHMMTDVPFSFGLHLCISVLFITTLIMLCKQGLQTEKLVNSSHD